MARGATRKGPKKPQSAPSPITSTTQIHENGATQSVFRVDGYRDSTQTAKRATRSTAAATHSQVTVQAIPEEHEDRDEPVQAQPNAASVVTRTPSPPPRTRRKSPQPPPLLLLVLPAGQDAPVVSRISVPPLPPPSSPGEYFEGLHEADSHCSSDCSSRCSTPTPTNPNATSTPPLGHGLPSRTSSLTQIPSSRRNPSPPRAGPHSPQRGAQMKSKKRSTKAAADIDLFFRVDGDERVCKLCESQKAKVIATYQLSTSTDNPRKHLAGAHLDTYIRGCAENKIVLNTKEGLKAVEEWQRLNGEASSGAPEGAPVPRFTNDNFLDAIVEWMVDDDQSINAIENPKLRRIFLMLRSQLKDSDIPHRAKIRQRIHEVWGEHLDQLREELSNVPGKISITEDIWSDNQLTSFMATTAHWIQPVYQETASGKTCTLKLRAELIGFHRIPGRHTGEHLAAATFHILERVGIAKKIGWITCDNATNNDAMMRELKKIFFLHGITFDARDRHIRCFPHIVNLAVQAILKAIGTNMRLASDHGDDFTPAELDPDLDPDSFEEALRRDPIAVIRALVRNIRISGLRRQAFIEAIEDINRYLDDNDKLPLLQLILDVITRWSSTYLMILRALTLREAIDRTISKNPDLHKYQISKAEWEALEDIASILEVAHQFQQRLSAEKTPTLCYTIPAFEAMKAMWRDAQNDFPHLEDIIQAALDKIEVYEDRVEPVPAYTVAMILNPAIKLSLISACSQDNSDEYDSARQLFVNEMRKYYTPATSNSAQPAQQRGRPARPNQRQHSRGGIAREILGMLDDQDVSTPRSTTESLESEVNRYLSEPLVKRGTMDSLTYWQGKPSEFPTLYKGALDYLPIPGSAVPCERVFSSAKETKTPRRNRIGAELMEELQMLKFFFKHGGGLDFTSGLKENEEIAYLNDLVDEIPSDTGGFAEYLRASR